MRAPYLISTRRETRAFEGFQARAITAKMHLCAPGKIKNDRHVTPATSAVSSTISAVNHAKSSVNPATNA